MKVGSAVRAVAALVVAVASLRAEYRAARGEPGTGLGLPLGAQTCSAYRAEVLRLHQLGIGREEFKELVPERVWRLGQSLQHERAETAYDGLAEGCGLVDELLGCSRAECDFFLIISSYRRW